MGPKDWVAFGGETKCSQCRTNTATGKVRMADNKWVNVCRACKRAMGVTKADNAKAHNQKPSRQPRSPQGSKPYQTKASRKPPETVKVESERLDK